MATNARHFRGLAQGLLRRRTAAAMLCSPEPRWLRRPLTLLLAALDGQRAVRHTHSQQVSCLRCSH